MASSALWALLGALTIYLLLGCGGSGGSLPKQTPGTYLGPPVTVGNGTARAYVEIGSDGYPTAAGAVLTETALTGLPTAEKTLFELPMPPEAVATVFNHIELRYWSGGHDPLDLFAVEHFDFIPFLITPQERQSITGRGEDLARVLKVPSSDRIPLGFAPIPDVDEFYAEPGYGTRYFDVANFTPVINKEVPYTTTLFYGYYNGEVNFLEIPLTLPYILSKPTAVNAIPLPKRVPRSGFYPTRYGVRYNPTTKEYRFALEGMVQR